MLSLLAFALISTAVKLNLLVPFDDAAESWAQQQVTPFHTALMLTFTQLASTTVVVVVTALLAAALALRKSGYWLGRLTLSVPGAMLLNEVLKHLFRRTRPALADPLVKLQTYSFPSGHAVAATVLYGFVAILFWSYIAPKHWRAVIGTAAATVVLLVAFSRVYLGTHYSTDVLAGVIEGVAWLSIAGMVTRHHHPGTTFRLNDCSHRSSTRKVF